MARSKLAVPTLAVLVLGVLVLAAPAAAQLWKGVAAVGIEVKSGKKKPLDGAQVLLRYAEIDPIDGPAPLATGADGRIEVQGLASGRWRVDVSKDGYSSYLLVVAVEPDGEARIVSGPVRDATGDRMRIEVFRVRPTALPELAPRRPARPAPPERAPEPVRPAPPERAPEPVRPAPAPPPVQPAPEPARPPLRPEPAPAAPEPAAPERAAPESPPPAPAEPAAAPEPTPPAPPVQAAPPEPVTAPEPEPPPAPPVTPPAPAVPAAEAAAQPEAAEPEPEEVPPAPVPDEVPPLPAPGEVPPAPAPAPPAAPEPPAPIAPPDVPAPAPEPGEVPPAPTPAPAPPTAPLPSGRPPARPAPPPAAEAPAAPPAAPPAPAPAPAAPPPARPAPPPAEPAPAVQHPPLPRISSALRSSADGTCPECEPGQSALMIEQLVGAAGLAPAAECAPDLAARLDRIAALLGDAGATAAEALISREGGALQLLRGTPAAGEAAALVTPFLRRDSACQALVAVLPPGARFTGYTYQASDAFGSGPCAAGEECAIGSATWTGEPTVVHTAGSTLVYGVFRNASQGRERLATLTIYFAPS